MIQLTSDEILNSPKTLPEGFNWISILKDLIQGAPITDQQHRKLVIFASKWPTCACGQLCASIPRRQSDNAPIDHRLVGLGTNFYHVVEKGEWRRALSIFYQIEERTQELIEIKEGLNLSLEPQ